MITVVRRKKKRYAFHRSDNKLLDLLLDFLIQEVDCFGGKTYKEWLLFDSSECATGNLMELYRDEEDTDNIWVYPEHTLGNEDVFFINKNDLVRVIDRWQELVKEGPKEIIITQNDEGEVTLEGNNKNVFPQSFLHFMKDEGIYRSGSASPSYFRTLNHLLEHDFSETPYGDVSGFKKWIEDDKADSFFDWRLFVHKEDGNIVINFNPEYSKKEDLFVIEKSKLVKIIDDFSQLAKAKVKTIVITEKDGEFIVEQDTW